MAKRLIFEFEKGGTIYARLLLKEAPKTCEAFIQTLPYQGEALHAMMAGEEIFMEPYPITQKLDFENESNDVEPGTVACVATDSFKRTRKQDGSSFCVFYGKSRPRKGVDQTIDVNVFGKVEDVEAMKAIGRRIRHDGAEKMSIRLSE